MSAAAIQQQINTRLNNHYVRHHFAVLYSEDKVNGRWKNIFLKPGDLY